MEIEQGLDPNYNHKNGLITMAWITLNPAEKKEFFKTVEFIKKNYDEFVTQKSLEQLEVAKPAVVEQLRKLENTYLKEKSERSHWGAIKEFLYQNNQHWELMINTKMNKLHEKTESMFYKKEINEYYQDVLVNVFSIPNKIELMGSKIEKKVLDQIKDLSRDIKHDHLPSIIFNKPFMPVFNPKRVF